MYCTITAGLLLSNVSVASLPCSNFDEVAIVEEQNKIATVAEAKVQVASIDHSYVPLPPSQPKRSEIKISTTTINLEPSNIKNMSLLVVHTPENVLKTSVATEHANKFVCLLKKLVASGYPIKGIGGYSYRKVFGTNYLSLHAYGKAIDVNQVRYNEVTVRQPKGTIAMAHECGLDSGAEWGTPDTGHFEVPTEGYGTRITRSDPAQSGLLSYASGKIQEFWNWTVH
ncbi:MAG TPA: M15 family metallopeptidase [Pseudolabrys sp.]|nr:M15 family metallopeptidase [Pseudolabrys sp.]